MKRSYEKTLVLKSFFPWIPDFPRISIFLSIPDFREFQLAKLNTLLKSVNTLETFAKAVIRSHNKTFFNKVSKILAEVRKVFNFEKFLIYVLPKFN